MRREGTGQPPAAPLSLDLQLRLCSAEHFARAVLTRRELRPVARELRPCPTAVDQGRGHTEGGVRPQPASSSRQRPLAVVRLEVKLICPRPHGHVKDLHAMLPRLPRQDGRREPPALGLWGSIWGGVITYSQSQPFDHDSRASLSYSPDD